MSELTEDQREALRKALEQPFPKSAIKKREGGRGMYFDYVEGHTVINRLNAVCPLGWDWELLNEGRIEWVGDVATVTGRLTIHGFGSRCGRGVQMFKANSGEDLLKGADTDALKVAAAKFGVALDLYGPDYEAYLRAESLPQPLPPPQRTVTQERHQVARAASRPTSKPDAAGIGDTATLLNLTRLLNGFGLDVCAEGKEPPHWSKVKTLAYFNKISDYILDLGLESPAKGRSYEAAIKHAPAWWKEQMDSGHPDTVPAGTAAAQVPPIVEAVLAEFGGEVVAVKEAPSAQS